jgi:hypothetical protein
VCDPEVLAVVRRRGIERLSFRAYLEDRLRTGDQK